MTTPGSHRVVWDVSAFKHFKDILSYLSNRSEQAPHIIKSAIFERLEIIKTNPLICEIDKLKYPQDNNFRAFIVFSYRITYQINADKKEIQILRVRHISREPKGY
jgi:mRNA-degrading endonuclease RelE of RelBE toxin-antitoxin system